MSQAKPFELNLEKAGLLQSADLQWGLDAPARLNVRTALPAKSRQDLALGSLPKSVDLKCQGKALFHGSLYSVRASGLNGLELEYRDSLDLLTRTFESEFLKGRRLEDFLSLLAQVAGLRPRFFGKFNQELAGLDLGGSSYFEHLQRMSFEYGFHFTVLSSAKELLFISLGAYRESVTVSAPVARELRSRRGISGVYGTAEVTAFDSQQGKSSKTEMAPSAIYEPLGFLKESGGFQVKAGWPLAAGRREAVSSAGVDPEKFRLSLSCQLSKQAAESESLSFTVSELPGFPGDRLELSSAPEKALEGKYLIQQVRTLVQSAVPSHEVTVIRA